MYYNEVAKEKIINAIHRQFDNPKELGTKLLEVYDSEVREILQEHLKDYQFPKDININSLLNYILVKVINKSSDGYWLDVIDTESGRDLSDPNEIEELENDNNSLMNIIVTHLDESCEVEIEMPERHELLNISPTVEYLKERIELKLSELSQGGLLGEIIANTEVYEIEPIVRKKAINNGFSEDYVDKQMSTFSGYGRPFKYEFKNPKVTVDANTLAETYIDKAKQDSASEFVNTYMVHEMIMDGFITYDIEVLDDPVDESMEW